MTNKYIVADNDGFNDFRIISDTLGCFYGKSPLYKCPTLGIVPNDNDFIIFGEDDEFFYEDTVVCRETLEQLLELTDILLDNVTSKFDHNKQKYIIKYKRGKRNFFKQHFKTDNLFATTQDRGKLDPLITINNVGNHAFNGFSSYWLEPRREVIADVLKNT